MSFCIYMVMYMSEWAYHTFTHFYIIFCLLIWVVLRGALGKFTVYTKFQVATTAAKLCVHCCRCSMPSILHTYLINIAVCIFAQMNHESYERTNAIISVPHTQSTILQKTAFCVFKSFHKAIKIMSFAFGVMCANDEWF